MRPEVRIRFAGNHSPGGAQAVLGPAGCGPDVATVEDVPVLRQVVVRVTLAETDPRLPLLQQLLRQHGEDWLGFLFLIDRHRGEAPARNEEGELEWVEIARLAQLPLWEGDRHFLPLVFDSDPRPFHGVMPYRDGRMQSWAYSR